MIYYYQYDADGWLASKVTSNAKPNHNRQFSSVIDIDVGNKKYDPQNQTVTTYKYTYGDDGEVTGRVVDSNVAVIQVGA